MDKKIIKISEILNITDLPKLSYGELKKRYNSILPEGPLSTDGNAITWGGMWRDEWILNNRNNLDSSINDRNVERSRIEKIESETNKIINNIVTLINITNKKNGDNSFMIELNDLVSKYSNLLPKNNANAKVVGPNGIENNKK